MSDSIGIPGYRILRKLGQGGMASVYLAVQESFDREVALKVMSPILNSDPSFATRFLREARIVAQIHHSSIVPVVDVGQAGGHHYLSMEYLPSGDLKQRIVDGLHGVNLALNVCVAISSALDLAHRKGFVHRDIKPENILFREDGTPVLTDFGIARAIDAGTQLTMAGTMVGTPTYMSPEQIKGGELDGRSDLYSLGVVFYEMLTGLVPFRADSTMSLAIKHLNEPLPLLPPQLAIYQPFLDRLMSKDREDRFGTGAEVIRALRLITDMAIAREQTITRNRPSQPQAGLDMPTLVAPNTTGSMNVPPSAEEPGIIRIPSTPTQPSGIMQIPSLAARPSGVHAAPVVAPTQQLEVPDAAMAQPTLVALSPANPPANMARPDVSEPDVSEEDATVPRPSGLPPVARPQPKIQAKPARPPGVPLQVRAQAALQKVVGSKHSTWAAAAVVALLAIGTGYLVGRTTDAEVPPVPVVATVPPKVIEPKVIEQGLADAASPPAAVPLAEGTDQPAEATSEGGREVMPSVEDSPIAGIQVAPDPVAAPEPTPQDDGRRKQQDDEKKRRAERDAAQKLLAQQQRERNAQYLRARAENIKQLLQLAKIDIAQGRLVSPTNNNAADRYREVLSKEPAPPEAQEARNGLKRIAEILVSEIYLAADNGSKEIAQQLLVSLRSVESDHPDLGKLQARVDASEGGKRLSKSQQRELAKITKLLEEALDRDPQTLASVKDAEKLYRKAQNISSTASGMSILRVRLKEAFAAAVRSEMDKGNTKQAREIISLARGRDWLTPDLQQLEQTLDATQSP